MQQRMGKILIKLFWITVGSAIYALGFDLFLVPNRVSSGGISGLAMIIQWFIPVLPIGAWSVLINIPLFLGGYRLIGRNFFWGSLVGMFISSAFVDLFALLPTVSMEPLLGAVYGGAFMGIGCGIVFMQEASTGGIDIAARLLKCKLKNMSIGRLSFLVDVMIAAVTGIAFRDVNKVLYSLIAVFVTAEVLDVVVYRFDFSYVATIITGCEERIRDDISDQLGRSCTILDGEGGYSGKEKKIIYCVIKRRQAAELRTLVMQNDPAAFFVLQEAHQVLGEGFDRYSPNQL